MGQGKPWNKNGQIACSQSLLSSCHTGRTARLLMGWDGHEASQASRECAHRREHLVSRGGPWGSERAQASEAIQLWAEAWALGAPKRLCIFTCIMGTTNSLLPDLYVCRPRKRPPLTTAVVTGMAGQGQEGGRVRGGNSNSLGGITSAPGAQTEWKLAHSANPSFIGPVFLTVKPQRTKGPANGEGVVS